MWCWINLWSMTISWISSWSRILKWIPPITYTRDWYWSRSWCTCVARKTRVRRQRWDSITSESTVACVASWVVHASLVPISGGLLLRHAVIELVHISCPQISPCGFCSVPRIFGSLGLKPLLTIAWSLCLGIPVAFSSVNGSSIIGLNGGHPSEGGVPVNSRIIWASVVRDMAW